MNIDASTISAFTIFGGLAVGYGMLLSRITGLEKRVRGHEEAACACKAAINKRLDVVTDKQNEQDKVVVEVKTDLKYMIQTTTHINDKLDQLLEKEKGE